MPRGGVISRGWLYSGLNAAAQTGRAPLAPVRLVGLSSSRPTHTTPTRLPVNPANQASRLSLVVPVLPATPTDGGMILFSADAVPLLTTPCIAYCNRYSAFGSATFCTVSG